jgi:hypothetical protein
MAKKIDLNKFKEVVVQLKTKQQKLQGLMNRETLKDAKRYAEASRLEIQKLIKNTDVKKVKSLIAKEAGEIKKLQNAIPGELARFSKFVETQAKELEKILKAVNALEAADFLQKKVSEKVNGVRKSSSQITKKTAKKASVIKTRAVKTTPAETVVAQTEAPLETVQTESNHRENQI